MFNLSIFAQDGYLGLPDSKLPSLQRISISSRGSVRKVEFETRPIEPIRLADCFDVRLLQCKYDTESSKNDIRRLRWRDEGDLEGSQLSIIYVSAGSNGSNSLLKDLLCGVETLHKQQQRFLENSCTVS